MGEAGCGAEVQLADPLIEREVRRTFGPSEGPFSGQDLAEVTMLSVPADGAVSDLGGLECMVNLRTLRVPTGSIRSLEPLSALTHLVSVSFSNNNVADLTPLHGKPELARVSANGNAVEDLGKVALPPAECGILTLTDNPLDDSAEAAIERFCADGWYVVWGSGRDITSCNPQCTPQP